MKVFNYVLFVALCLGILSGCDPFNEDDRKVDSYSVEFDVLMDSIELALAIIDKC